MDEKGVAWQSETTSSPEIWDLLGQGAENGLTIPFATLKFLKLAPGNLDCLAQAG
jgi:hypothetical protein